MANDNHDRRQRPGQPVAATVPRQEHQRICGEWSASPRCPVSTTFGAAETFTTADATTVENWAVVAGHQHALVLGCPARQPAAARARRAPAPCSGVAQSTWQFSQAFQPFTSGGSQAAATPRTTTTDPPPPTTTTAPVAGPGGCTGCRGVETTRPPTTAGMTVTNGGHKVDREPVELQRGARWTVRAPGTTNGPC